MNPPTPQDRGQVTDVVTVPPLPGTDPRTPVGWGFDIGDLPMTGVTVALLGVAVVALLALKPGRAGLMVVLLALAAVALMLFAAGPRV